MGLRLFFLPQFPWATFIQGATFITDSRVIIRLVLLISLNFFKRYKHLKAYKPDTACMVYWKLRYYSKLLTKQVHWLQRALVRAGSLLVLLNLKFKSAKAKLCTMVRLACLQLLF